MLVFSIFLVAGSLVYCILTIVAARRYLAAVPPALAENPEPISILKPLSGLDLDLETNLRTFFEQEYPCFEVLFAARDADDPAARLASRLMSEYAHIRSRLFITGDPPYPNAKVYSLDRMLAEAAHDLVIMSDSDTRVTPGLLKAAAREFQDSQTGIATCPYRAIGGASFWSRLEAIGMNTDFLAGILVARLIEGMRFAVGPTIIARRHVLESIGGFDRLKDFLAEDFVMGQFAAEAGHRVILSSYVIEHHIGTSDFRHNAAHRLRWVRSTRRSRPLGYLGQVFTMPVPWALLTVLLSPSWWPLLLLALTVRASSAHMVASSVLHAKLNWPLLFAEDLAAFFFWWAGFFGNTISWRGRRYRLRSDGRFELLNS